MRNLFMKKKLILSVLLTLILVMSGGIGEKKTEAANEAYYAWYSYDQNVGGGGTIHRELYTNSLAEAITFMGGQAVGQIEVQRDVVETSLVNPSFEGSYSVPMSISGGGHTITLNQGMIVDDQMMLNLWDVTLTSANDFTVNAQSGASIELEYNATIKNTSSSSSAYALNVNNFKIEGTISCTNGEALQTSISGSTKQIESSAKISGGTYGVHVRSLAVGISNAIHVNGGTITGGTYGIFNEPTRGIIHVGKNDGTISQTSPAITGEVAGFYGSNLYFYDGYIRGRTEAINCSTDVIIPDFTQIVHEYGTYDKAYLGQLTLTNATFNINPESIIYTGNNITTEISKSLILNGISLSEGIDFTLSYSNNKNVGTATITATGTGNYSGTKTKNFQITKATPTVILRDKSAEYTGSPISGETATIQGVSSTDTPTGSFAYTYYTDSTCTTQTTNANSGASGTGKPPVNSGIYYMKAVFTSTSNNYTNAEGVAVVSIAESIIDINNMQIIVSPLTYTYDGTEKRPNVIIKSQSETPIRVTLDATGGSVSPNYVDVYYGTSYGVLPTATRANYTQNGWWTTSSGGTQITENTSVTNNANHSIYAHWVGNSYTVTFNPNGGSCATSSKSVTYGGTYGTLPTPTRSGYTFDGWYTAETGGTERTSTSAVTLTGNEVLYAHWTRSSFISRMINVSPVETVEENGITHYRLHVPSGSSRTISFSYQGDPAEAYISTWHDPLGTVSLTNSGSGGTVEVSINRNMLIDGYAIFLINVPRSGSYGDEYIVIEVYT